MLSDLKKQEYQKKMSLYRNYKAEADSLCIDVPTNSAQVL